VSAHSGVTFARGDRVTFDPMYLAEHRLSDARWYAENKDGVGTVDWIDSEGNALLLWDGAAETTIHAPHRLERAVRIACDCCGKTSEVVVGNIVCAVCRKDPRAS
jgi:hypothetical protein